MKALIMQTLAEVAVAALVAGGIMSLIRFLEECIATPKPLTIAVTVRTEAQFRNLDILLAEAYRHSVRTRRQAPVVLLDRHVTDGQWEQDGRVQALLEQYGAVCYLVDMNAAGEEEKL